GDRPSYIENLRAVMNVPTMLLLITIMFLVSSAAVFVRPVVPLLVEGFTKDDVAAKSGFVFAAIALTSAIAAVVSGRIAARTGYRGALILATLGAGVAYITVGFANSLLPLMLLMAMVG